MGLHHHHHHGDHGPRASSDPHDQHALANPATTTAFRWSTLLNVALVVFEAGVGLAIGSMALVADAGHNLGDVLGLLLAWGATRLALRRPTARHTYGMARSTILAALLNAAILLVACGALTLESIRRIGDPQPVPGMAVMAVALLALLVNAGSAALFWRSRRSDVNARGAFLHLASDAAVSLGVVVVGGVVAVTGWHWLDPAAGIGISIVIGLSSIGLLREALALSLDAVPRGMDLAAIDAALREVPGVRSVHDLHVWSLSTTAAALTAHLEHDGTRDGDALLADAQRVIVERFGIRHTTLQFENVGCGRDCIG
jgi:cobalt-zinc-cadmium efflux system protein